MKALKDPNPRLETPPLSRAGRKIADAILARAQFKATVDGKRLVRQYEVYGIEVTEWMDADKASEASRPDVMGKAT